MADAVAIVIPVFALIGLGYLFGFRGWFPPGTGKGLADFTFTLAVPAMLFRTVASTDLPAGAALGVWGSFFGALLATWALAALLTHVLLRRPQADAASIAMSSTYGNVVMLGIPLAATAYGAAANGPIAILLSVHTPLLWLVGSMHIALAGISKDASMVATLRAVVIDLARNPIIMAVLAGTAWRLTGLGIAPVLDRILTILGQASVPTALVALGLGLVNFEIKGQTWTLATVCALKLVVMPLLAAALALGVFRLDPVAAGVVILFAAMPAGANAYLFANKYQRAVNSASGAVALGTVLSAVTAAAIIYGLK